MPQLARTGPVVVLDLDDRLEWAHPAVRLVSGDASDPQVALEAARVAEDAARYSSMVTRTARPRSRARSSTSRRGSGRS